MCRTISKLIILGTKVVNSIFVFFFDWRSVHQDQKESFFVEQLEFLVYRIREDLLGAVLDVSMLRSKRKRLKLVHSWWSKRNQ